MTDRLWGSRSGEPSLNVSQKKFPNKFQFRFGNESLGYSRKYKGEVDAFEADYSGIAAEHGSYEERNIWYRHAAVLWLAIGVFFSAYQYLTTGELLGSVWLLLGFLCLVLYLTAKTRYTVINTPAGDLWIVADKKHDFILDEIESRRSGRRPG